MGSHSVFNVPVLPEGVHLTGDSTSDQRLIETLVSGTWVFPLASVSFWSWYHRDYNIRLIERSVHFPIATPRYRVTDFDGDHVADVDAMRIDRVPINSTVLAEVPVDRPRHVVIYEGYAHSVLRSPYRSGVSTTCGVTLHWRPEECGRLKFPDSGERVSCAKCLHRLLAEAEAETEWVRYKVLPYEDPRLLKTKTKRVEDRQARAKQRRLRFPTVFDRLGMEDPLASVQREAPPSLPPDMIQEDEEIDHRLRKVHVRAEKGLRFKGTRRS